MMKLVLCLSGKGGVGKTTVALATALALSNIGQRAGYLSCDLENCCAAELTGLTNREIILERNLKPIPWNGIEVFGISLLLPPEHRDIPILMMEDRETAWIDQLLSLDWGCDYLVADLPPGSGPEVRAMIPHEISGAIIVTAPQSISEQAVARTIRMCQEEYGFPILGLVENNINNVEGAAAANLSRRYHLPIITSIPWSPDLVRAMEDKRPLPHECFAPIAHAIIGKDWDANSIRALKKGGMGAVAIARLTSLPRRRVYAMLKGEPTDQAKVAP